MPLLIIRHITTYHYKAPVAFGEHRMMLRPRDDGDQRILDSEIAITPAPSRVSWTQDAFGNHVAEAHFDAQASLLRFESTIRLHHSPTDFQPTDIAHAAWAFPFVYDEADRREAAAFLAPLAQDSCVARWAAGFVNHGPTGTYDLLSSMTRAICAAIAHVARHENGIQTPAATLRLGAGCCRDRAVLMIEALRALGVASRFVSGYLHVSDEDEVDDIVGGNTHAWAQAYIPGPGWVDLDPSTGVVGNHNLVRVAIVHDPRDALPLQGTWIGDAADHIGMKVAVRVHAPARACGDAPCQTDAD